MTNRSKPISASNPPDSRGNRGAKELPVLVLEKAGEPAEEKKAINQPTLVEPSPKKKVKKEQ